MNSLNEEDLKREICEVSLRLYNKGLLTVFGGNISARLPNQASFWITPSKTFKGMLKPKDLVKMDLSGKVILGSLEPSIEWRLHRNVYKVRRDINAVIHAHNPAVIGLIAAGLRFKPMSVEGKLIVKRIEVIPYLEPGSLELADEVARRAINANALILSNHGVIGLGVDLTEAQAIVEALEQEAFINLISTMLKKLSRI